MTAFQNTVSQLGGAIEPKADAEPRIWRQRGLRFLKLFLPWLFCGVFATIPLFARWIQELAAYRPEASAMAEHGSHLWQTLLNAAVSVNAPLAVALALSSGYICSTLFSRNKVANFLMVFNFLMYILLSICYNTKFASASIHLYLSVVFLCGVALLNLFGFCTISWNGKSNE